MRGNNSSSDIEHHIVTRSLCIGLSRSVDLMRVACELIYNVTEKTNDVLTFQGYFGMLPY